VTVLVFGLLFSSTPSGTSVSYLPPRFVAV
jgi:hypothetical protein